MFEIKLGDYSYMSFEEAPYSRISSCQTYTNIKHSALSYLISNIFTGKCVYLRWKYRSYFVLKRNASKNKTEKKTSGYF